MAKEEGNQRWQPSWRLKLPTNFHQCMSGAIEELNERAVNSKWENNALATPSEISQIAYIKRSRI